MRDDTGKVLQCYERFELDYVLAYALNHICEVHEMHPHHDTTNHRSTHSTLTIVVL